MKRVIEQSIPNEFSPSLIYYHIDHNENLTNGYYNPAELTAMREERLRLEEEQKKQILYEENLQKYKNNIKKYNQIHNQDTINETAISVSSVQRGKEYNENLRKQMKIKKEKKNQKKKKNDINNIDNSKKNNIISTNDAQQFTQGSEVMNTFSFKNQMNSLTTEENNNNFNINENFKNNNNYTNDNLKKNINLNNNVRDLSGNILEQIIEQSTFINNNSNILNTNSINNMNEDNIKEKKKKDLEMVKNISQNGIISLFNDNNNNKENNNNNNLNDNMSNLIKPNEINESISSSFHPSQYPNTSFNISFHSNSNFYNNSNMTELQQKRYQKALRKMMIEQLKNNQINIPSICSCGQLQRKIDALLNENREITPDDLMNVDCANNCIYYQKPGEYHRALSNIIHGIRNLKMKNNKK